MLYQLEKSHTVAEAFRDLNELFGEETICKRQIRMWFSGFTSGNTSSEDEKG